MNHLVSCVMVTRNRRQYVSDAIHCFLNQTYPYRELVVVDDGDDQIGDLLPDGTKYIRCEPSSIGRKRNIGAEIAVGKFIAHWDDDDISGPDRLAFQVRDAVAYGARLVGFNVMDFIDDERCEAWKYTGTPHYALGTSFLYPKAVWSGHQFQDIGIAEDNEFQWALPSSGRYNRPADNLLIARNHSQNTSPRMLQASTWTKVNYGWLKSVTDRILGKAA